mmetsp:Transcript_15999/g.23218  ORF Transcript_15999/g.23218 Transcript_15999/m.23218 type:complete len:126 (+) Transcript_15999:549-926(+)
MTGGRNFQDDISVLTERSAFTYESRYTSATYDTRDTRGDAPTVEGFFNVIEDGLGTTNVKKKVKGIALFALLSIMVLLFLQAGMNHVHQHELRHATQRDSRSLRSLQEPRTKNHGRRATVDTMAD